MKLWPLSAPLLLGALIIIIDNVLLIPSAKLVAGPAPEDAADKHSAHVATLEMCAIMNRFCTEEQ